MDVSALSSTTQARPFLCGSSALAWTVTILALGCLALGAAAYFNYLPGVGVYGSIGLLSAGGALLSFVLARLAYQTCCLEEEPKQQTLSSAPHADTLEAAVRSKKTRYRAALTPHSKNAEFLTKFLDFYRGTGTSLIDNKKDGQEDTTRTLTSVLGWDDKKLEAEHDFIQWIFATNQVSESNTIAPVLDDATIQIIRTDPTIQANAKLSFLRIMRFYGFSYDAQSNTLNDNHNAQVRIQAWTKPKWGRDNHNFLRISRILRSLELFGLQAEKQAFWNKLTELATSQTNRKIASRCQRSYNKHWATAFAYEWHPQAP